MMYGQRLHLRRQVGQERAAMFADDLAVGFRTLEILPDRRFGNAERLAQYADARAAFHLQPVEDTPAARFGEQAASSPFASSRPSLSS